MPVITDRDEALEHSHLAELLEIPELTRGRVAASIDRSAAAIQASKELVWTRRRDMGHAEKANIRTDVDVSVGVAERAVEPQRRLERLLDSPCSGRIDFRPSTTTTSAPYYIGLHTFRDPDSTQLLIHDWRAPAAALYYASNPVKRPSRHREEPLTGRSPANGSTRSRTGGSSTCWRARWTSATTSCSRS